MTRPGSHERATSPSPPRSDRKRRHTARGLPPLASGQLRKAVEQHLYAYPGLAFTCWELARVLGGRSHGAVANACRRLVADGKAVQTSTGPRRFRAAAPPPEQARC